METLFHPLYTPPPLTFPLKNYQFILDVPQGFHLLEQNYKKRDAGGKRNRQPEHIVKETIKHNEKIFTRYRLWYKSDFVKPYQKSSRAEKNQIALIPLILKNFSSNSKHCQFYYHRLASGNITEVEQTLPVEILPPINGRLCENISIQQYMGLSNWAAKDGMLFPSHMEREIKQGLDAGFNRWLISAQALPNSLEGSKYGKRIHDLVIQGGGQVVIRPPANYPLWGNNNMGSNSAMAKFMLAHPNARARYFKNRLKWTINRRPCPTYTTGKARDQYKAAIKKDIEGMILGDKKKFIGLPKAKFYWVDWEQTPWNEFRREDPIYSRHLYCFCNTCKEAFRKYANLSKNCNLADDSIHINYKEKWANFRRNLDGRTNSITREVCNDLGLKYLYYDMVSLEKNWPPLRGKIDIACPGLPGGDTFYGVKQAKTDHFSDFLRKNKIGARQIVGQTLAMGFWQKDGQPWGAWTSRQEPFFSPKILKSTILRIVAATLGGVELSSSFERAAGMKYYIGEATRLLAQYEDIFWNGERDDKLAVSQQITYPNLLVIKKGYERLVFLFNDENKIPQTVELQNLLLQPGQTAYLFYAKSVVHSPQIMFVTIPPEDVEVIYIK